MATLYVDWKNGLDANTGGTADPLKTLSHCLAAHAGNGDTIKLRGSGAADEIYYDVAIASALTGLTIEADTGHTPVLSSSVAYTVWVLTGGTTNVYETADATGVAWAAWNGATQLTSVGSIVACDALTNSYYYDGGANKLYVNIGGVPTVIEAGDTWAPAWLSFGANGTIRGLTFHHFTRAAINCSAVGQTVSGCTFAYYAHPLGYAPVALSSTGTLVDGCTNNAGAGGAAFDFGAASQATVSNCAINNTFGLYITNGAGHVIDNVTITGTVYNANRGHISLVNLVTGVTIRNCALGGGAYYYIFIDVGVGHVITGCTCTGGAQEGVYFSAATSGTMSYCTVSDSVHANYIQVGAPSTCVFHHCIAYSTHDVGQGYGWVVHNAAVATYYHCIAAYADRCTGVIRAGWYVLDAGSTATWRNCIAYHNTMGFGADVGTIPDLDYCLANGNGVDYSGMAPGAHDATGDPLLVNVGAYSENFHVKAGSPCIDAGLSIPGINGGYSGTAPDIGAYEYVPFIPYWRPLGSKGYSGTGASVGGAHDFGHARHRG